MRSVLFLLALAACGGAREDSPGTPTRSAANTAVDEKAPTDDAFGESVPTTTAPFVPTFPEVVNVGGHVVSKPVVQPIVFAGDPLASTVEDFTQKVSASTYWQSIGAEYGVSSIAPRTPVSITETAPTTITSKQVEAFLRDRIAVDPFGPLDPSTLYILYYPSGTTITATELGTSCVDFGGYHGEISVNGVAVGYAVIPRCDDVDTLTVSASHEMFEWATNPLPKTQPAYARVDDAHPAWNAVMVGEISDLCTFLDRKNVMPTEVGYRVQRQWSNALSKVGAFPCAPYDGIANFQAIPEQQIISMPKNGARKVAVHLYSDVALATAMTLKVLTKDAWYGRPTTHGISATLSTTTGHAGDVISLTVSATGDATEDDVIVFSRSGDATHLWPVHVVTN